MNSKSTTSNHSLIYYRLITLWALAEAMLGGIIHGFKIPVSGLVVGSCAIICICLIGWYVPQKGSILKATIIVAVFKMMLSPQSPPPAYIAVFFQGLLGELLFWNRRFFRLSCVLLAVLALLESGFQRILMLTIVYGNDLWKVINDFVNGLTKQKTTTNYSLIIGGGYVLLHFIAGILVGWWAGGLPRKVKEWKIEKANRGLQSAGMEIMDSVKEGSLPSIKKNSPGKKKRKKGLFVIWVILVGLYVQSYFKIGEPLLPPHISLKILLRSLIIVLSWYFLVRPVLEYLLHKWLQKKKAQSGSEIQRVLDLLPHTRQLVAQSWKQAGGKSGWNRLITTGKLILANALDTDQPKEVIILTGPVQTGKTSSLLDWSKNRTDVFGILTPVRKEKRVFMNANTKETFVMEAAFGEKEVLTIGRFVFSKKNFDKAIEIILHAAKHDGWLLIDEIGPMELRGEGFAAVFKEVLRSGNKKQKVIIVVREGMVEKVKEFFEIPNAVMIDSISALSGQNTLSTA